jgi:nicotinamidase-related amidase
MSSNGKRDWERFALLLIDVQRDFWSERLQPIFPDFAANIERLLALCRSEGLEVIHLRAIFQPDMSDWMLRYRLRGRIPCVAGTEGAETMGFAKEQPGEQMIIKQTFDGFHSPELLPYLRERGKRFLLTAGLVTSTCVLLTTASATQLGFLTAVVEDCCADEPFIHEQTLERYQFIFDRTTTGAICEDHGEWVAALEKLT